MTDSTVPQKQRSAWLRYGVTLFLVALATIARAVTYPYFGQSVPFLFFFPPVILAAIYGGFGPGLFATGLSALAAEYWIEPVGSLAIASPTLSIALAFFVMINIVNVWICERMNQAIRRAAQADAFKESAEVNAKLAEAQQAEEFRLLAEAMPQIVWITRADGWNTYFNQQWVDYTGLTLEESYGHGWNKPFHPDDQARAWDAWQNAVANRATYALECQLRRADGVYRWWLIRGVPVLDKNGNVLKWFGTCTDIHNFKLAEEALRERESEERFRVMVNAMPQLAWIARPDGYIFWYNQRWYDYTGTTPEQMEGWGWQSVHDETELPKVMEHWKASIATGDPFEMTFPLRGADGIFRPFLTRGYPLKDADGRVIRWFGTNTDISERKQAEMALNQAKEDAEEANRAKDRFLAILSHELRTPLTPALMIISAHQTDTALSADLREDLTMVRRSLELEARLIDDLLDINRLARGKIALRLQPTDLHRALRDVLTICHEEIEAKSLTLRLELDAPQHNVNGDSGRLQQVFWNLLKNAIKFTPEGGILTVRTLNFRAGIVRTEVADTGIGIDPQVIPRLFVPFEQGEVESKHQFGGLGLGLSICKALVALHGGVIWVESGGAGKGATFFVELETTEVQFAVEPAGTPKQTAAKWSPKIGDHNLRILLVEDNADTLRILHRLLERAGCNVTPTQSVSTALDAARKARGEGGEKFDLVISDLGLPDGDGRDIMRELHDRDGLSGIAISGFGMEEDIENSRAAGFAKHLTKPIQIEELQAAISDLVGHLHPM